MMIGFAVAYQVTPYKFTMASKAILSMSPHIWMIRWIIGRRLP